MAKNPKKRLRSIADKLWFKVCLETYCLLCGKPATQVHHFFPKGQYGWVRYDIDNGISLCNGCHYRLHHIDPTLAVQIIENKGKKWYNKLKKKAIEEHRSFQTVGWYKGHIKRLKEL